MRLSAPCAAASLGSKRRSRSTEEASWRGSRSATARTFDDWQQLDRRRASGARSPRRSTWLADAYAARGDHAAGDRDRARRRLALRPAPRARPPRADPPARRERRPRRGARAVPRVRPRARPRARRPPARGDRRRCTTRSSRVRPRRGDRRSDRLRGQTAGRRRALSARGTRARASTSSRSCSGRSRRTEARSSSSARPGSARPGSSTSSLDRARRGSGRAAIRAVLPARGRARVRRGCRAGARRPRADRPATRRRAGGATRSHASCPSSAATPTAPLDSLAAQSRFYEAVCALLTDSVGGNGPGVVVVDDLHWADEASLGLLGYLVNRLRGRPLLVALTWRRRGGRSGHRDRRDYSPTPGASARRPAASWRSAGSRGRVGHARAPGGQDGASPRASCIGESGGLPFFVVEYLDALARRGSHGRLADAGRGSRAAPRPGRRARRARGQVVAAAGGARRDRSTRRRSATRAVAPTTRSSTALEELVRAGLLLEAQRRSLRLPARAGARSRLRADDPRPAPTAPPAGRVGARGCADAARRRQRRSQRTSRLGRDDLAAAEQLPPRRRSRARLYANVEASSHYRAALALGDPGVAELQTALGDLATLAGDYGGAMAAYETAAATPTAAARPGRAPPRPPPPAPRRVGARRRRADLCRRPAPAGGRARGRSPIAASPHTGAATPPRPSRSPTTLSTLAERTDDHRRSRRPTTSSACSPVARRRRRAAVQRWSEPRAARLAGDREAEAAALNNLARVASRDGETDRGDRRAHRPRRSRSASRLGDRHREAALRNNRADLLHRSGRGDESMAALKLAVAIFAEIGEDGRLEPEIWKLTDW